MPSKPVLVTFLLILCVAVAVGCRRSRSGSGALPPLDPEETKELVQQLGGKGVRSFGADSRIMIAKRLGDSGPAVKEYGAVEALEKLTKDKDPKVSAAAKEALAKIQGQ